MSRLLLSLWLLGAVVFTANTLVYANVIFGWSDTKPKVEVSKAAEQQVEPSPAAEMQDQTASLAEVQSVALQTRPEETPSLPAAEPQPQDESEWARVSRTAANVRSGPSSSASELGTLRSGVVMRVISRQAGWVQIANADGSQTGWIYERLLEPAIAPSEQGAGSAELAAAGQQQQTKSEWVRVSGAPATMRSGPSDSAPLMFGFPEGKALRVMSRQPDWVQVVDPGSNQSGWIAEASLAGAQQTANISSQRRSRDAGPRAYDIATRGAWVPLEDGIEPGDRQRGRGHGRSGGMAGILSRALGGF